jgi:tetratricopeptide (TPR) repeat protein
MNDNLTLNPPDADARLAAALEEYQTALELGLPLDRLAFLARFAELPDLAADLDALDLLHRTGDEPDAPPAEPTLADFEIIREAGRGGMGIVYEARQISLNRRVAVKVLTQAAALDDRTRKRFLHEARAAALVHHPNVVPVYHVGEEQGVPFYVMPFVPGVSLAVAIQSRRKPDVRGTPSDPLPPAGTPGYFQAVASVGQQAAAALAEAHAQGVIHRDVKPANLLLDPAGKVWVTDFGLALAPFADGLTRTGARPGTPRYMSPEQLTGPRQAVDARTDVYSLGVTLYELATLRSAFEAGDELDLIQRITRGNPAHPRSVTPAIPADLETVILKAMARDPADRYSTAQELADDFTRFLDGRPVLAHRPGPVLTLRRWVRRHRRPLLTGGAILLSGVLAGLSASTIAVWRAYQSEREAHAAAESRRQMAVVAITEMGAGADDILAHAPGMQGRWIEFLERCRDRLAPFADDPSVPWTVRWEIALVHQRLGMAYAVSGRNTEAESEWRRGLDRLTTLIKSAPVDANYPRLLAEMHLHLCGYPAIRGDHTASREILKAGMDYAEMAYRLQPTRATVIVTRHTLRCALADLEEKMGGTPGSSLAAYREALEASEALRDRYPTGHPLSYMRLAEYEWEVAIRHLRLGDSDAAERCLVKAVGYDEHLVKHFADQPPDIRQFTLHPRGDLGLLRVSHGRIEEGLPDMRKSVADLKRFVGLYPHVVSYKRYLLLQSGGLAHAELLAGHPVEARSAASQCMPLLADSTVPLPVEDRARLWALLPFADLRDAALGEKLLSDPAVTGWPRAAIQYRLERFEEALRGVETEKTPASQLIRAAALTKLGRADEAKPVFDKATTKLATAPVREPDIITLQREVADVLSAAHPR